MQALQVPLGPSATAGTRASTGSIPVAQAFQKTTTAPTAPQAKAGWSKVRRVSSAPMGLITAMGPRPSQHTPRWKGHGLAGILDAACAPRKPERRKRIASDHSSQSGPVSPTASSCMTGDVEAIQEKKGTAGMLRLVKKLEGQYETHMLKLIRLEEEAETNILESELLRQRSQELQKTEHDEQHRFHEQTVKGKKADKQLRQLINEHANTKYDFWRNKKNWTGAVKRDDEEIKKLIHAVTQPRSGPEGKTNVDPRTQECANNLVAKVQHRRSVNSIKPDDEAKEHIGELKRRCASAKDELVGIGVCEKVLKEDVARDHISFSILERDLKCAESTLNGLSVAASKEASQFQQYEREKQCLEDELEEKQQKEADNYLKARQIKANAIIARKEAQEKLYLGELEVRRLDSVLHDAKDRTAEHIAEAELLQQWEARLPAAHLNQYKMADDNFYKLVGTHHELNAKLREVLDKRQAEFEASRSLDATPEFGLQVH